MLAVSASLAESWMTAVSMNAREDTFRRMQQGAGARERQTGIGSDQQWLASGGGRGEFACNDGAGACIQRFFQMFLILNENQVTPLGCRMLATRV